MGDNRDIKPSRQMSEIFGRVFLRKQDSTEYELVDGARFSNLKLRIFRGDVEDETYRGRPFCLGITGNRLQVPIPLGTNKIPDMCNIDKAFERELSIAKDLKLLDEHDEPDIYASKLKLISNTRMSLFYALTSPNMDIVTQNLLLDAGPLTYLDDLLENLGDGGDSTRADIKLKGGIPKMKLPYQCTSRLSHAFLQWFQADEDKERDKFEEMIENPKQLLNYLGAGDNEKLVSMITSSEERIVEFYSLFHLMLGYMSRIRKSALTAAKANGCSAKPYLNTVATAVDKFCLELSQEWSTEVNASEETYTVMLPSLVSLRRDTTGGLMFLECILLQNGIDIAEEIRSCALFLLIMEQVAVQFHKVNELVSFDKEMRPNTEEWKSNEACALHKIHGIPVEKVKSRMAVEANSALKQLEKLNELLLSICKDTEGEEHIVRFVRLVGQAITGHIQWCALVQRYHQDLSLDCYID